MERPDQLGDFDAGSSPLRGVIVAVLGLVVGLLVLVQGFDARQSKGLESKAASPVSDIDESDIDESESGSLSTSSEPLEDETNDDILPPATPDETTTTTPATTTTTTVDSTTTTVAMRPVSEVVVLVVNSGAGKGSAGLLTKELTEMGYDTRSPKNADRSTASAIYYGVGYGAEAASLASDLGIGSELVIKLGNTPPLDDLQGANVVAVVTASGPLGG